MNTKAERSDRRKFLATAGALAGGGWLALNAPLLLATGEAAAEQRASGAGWAHLSRRQAWTLAAVADQIIPPDDLPGAAEIGVVWFIDQALGSFMAEGAGMLQEGLDDLDRRAQAEVEGAAFASLPFERQAGVLRSVESTPFFEAMIFLTHCGMFALPSWGATGSARAGT